MQICSFLACCYSASFLHEKYGVAKTRVRITQRVRVGVGVRVRVRVRMRVRVRVRIVVGIPILDLHPKFPPQNCLLYTLYFFEFYNSRVLDLARFEDHTFAYF